MDHLRDKDFTFFSDFLEWTPCDLCGGKEYKIIYPSTYTENDFFKDRFKSFTYANNDKARGNVVRCNACKLVYTTPRDKDVGTLYEKVEDDEYYFSSRSDRTKTFERDFKQLESVVKSQRIAGKRILDLGCSYGFFLDVAKERGWDTYGSELSKKQALFASQNHKNICSRELKGCLFKENFFDVITFYELIEHVSSPTKLLGELYTVLKDDGLLVLSTPDFSGLPSRVMGKYWLGIVRMHLYYFTPKSITNLLKKSGFEIIKIVRHKRIVRFGVAVEWMSKYPILYKFLNFIFGNSFIKNITITTGLSGNMVVYAKKLCN